MIPGIQDILMVCKNEQAISEKKQLLLSWINGDPSTVLKQAKRLNTATPFADYLQDLNHIIKSKFQRGCRPETRTLERERVIVRYVVYVNLQIMDRSTFSKKSPLVSHRNRETLVEASARERREDATDRGPSAGVVAQLQSATSFFDVHDRVRLGATAPQPSNPLPPITPHPTTPITTTPTSSKPDWSVLRVATLEETRRIRHRLVLHSPFCNIHLHHHPMEIYMAWRLHSTSHVYENLGAESTPAPLAISGGSTFVISDNGSMERFPHSLIVARPGSTIYDEAFPATRFQLPITKLLDFLVRRGRSDPTRSDGYRIELSNAGLAQDESSASFRPKDICGADVFLDDPDGPLVRAILGLICDGLTVASKSLCREMGMPRAMNHRRYTEYALKLQSFVYGSVSDTESITVQLLDLTAGDTGKKHYDILNDPRTSYDSTIAKVMFFIDGRGHLLSLKILCSYRKRLGDFYSVAMSKVDKLLANIKTMLEEVSVAYQRLVSHHRGSPMGERIATWADIDPLILNSSSPWETKKITPTITQRSLKTLTGVGRCLWLSAAWTQVHRLSANLDERGMIQLLMVTAWQNSFQKFWEVCERMDLSMDSYPLFEYYRVARELFYVPGKEKGQEMFGGEDPRFSPGSFDFKEVFGQPDDPRKDVVDKVVDLLLALCDSVNLLKGTIIRHGTFLDLVESTASAIRDEAKCELGAFRLMILLQGCAFLGVRVEKGTHLREMFFPVKGSGSWCHLTDVGIAENQIESVCREIQRELSTPSRPFWMDEVEVVLCESKNGRLLQKYDTFIYGQMLFKMDDEGSVWIKLFGENEWKEFKSKHRQ